MKTCEYCFNLIDEVEPIEYRGRYYCAEKCMESHRKEVDFYSFEDFKFKEEDTFLNTKEKDWLTTNDNAPVENED